MSEPLSCRFFAFWWDANIQLTLHSNCSCLDFCFYSKETINKRRGSQDVPIISCLKLHFYPGYFCSLKEPNSKWEYFVSKYEVVSSLCGWINVLKYLCWTRQVHFLNSCTTQFRIVPRWSRTSLFRARRMDLSKVSVQSLFRRTVVPAATVWTYHNLLSFKLHPNGTCYFLIFHIFILHQRPFTLLFSGRDGREGRNGME